MVLASAGYPGEPALGRTITGIDSADALPGVSVVHAATVAGESGLRTAGGRVLRTERTCRTDVNL